MTCFSIQPAKQPATIFKSPYRTLRSWIARRPYGATGRPPPPASSANVAASLSSEQKQLQLTASLVNSIAAVGQEEWNVCAAGTDAELNPFLLWEFLHALEASGSACPEQGWLPQHLLLRDSDGQLVGCCPLYAKGHSYGEKCMEFSTTRKGITVFIPGR